MRADADLDGAIGIDDAVANRARHKGTVVDPLVVVEPGVLMRVELHQRQRTAFGGMRLEDRPGHVMVAAQRQHEGARIDDRLRLVARSQLASPGGCRNRAGTSVQSMTAVSAKRSRLKGYCGSLSKIAEARRIVQARNAYSGRLRSRHREAERPRPRTSAPVRSLQKRWRNEGQRSRKMSGSVVAELRSVAVKGDRLTCWPSDCPLVWIRKREA